MKSSYQNAFFIVGLLLLCGMATQLDWHEVWTGIQHAGYWCIAILLLWGILYCFNTATWYLIIRSQEASANDSDKAPDAAAKQEQTTGIGTRLLFLYKVTVSGFALNYATPGGLMGGEPYKIMELTPLIGVERATSSVLLHTMTHIFSHFWFWLVSVGLFIATKPVDIPMAMVLALTSVFCLLGIWFFMTGYQHGLANKLFSLGSHIPIVKRWARPFIDKHKQQLDNIDRQIAALHAQNRRTFIAGVLLELSCRILSALEILLILLVLSVEVNFLDCILILAFTSLLANLLFFMPLQLGGREGGFLLSITGLGITTSAAIFVALIVRLRELFWTALGLLLIKVKI